MTETTFTGLVHDVAMGNEIRREFGVPWNIPFSAQLPDEIDPRPWHKIEDQGPMNSCGGNASASVGEKCHLIASGEVTQFSRMWAYLRGQAQTPQLFGRDGGSTIRGLMQAAMADGYCREEVFPYPSPVRYSTAVPSGAKEDAAQFRIKTGVAIEGYHEGKNFLGANQGGLLLGMPWPISLDANGIMTGIIGGGWHAVAGLGYDHEGRIWTGNSHSTRYGLAGWFRIPPDWFARLLSIPGTVVVGMSDLTSPTPRVVDWTKERPMG